MTSIQTETEFKRFIDVIGPWFEGMAKFIAIMSRHNDDIYTGERLMLQRLERETFKIDKHIKELLKSGISEVISVSDSQETFP